MTVCLYLLVRNHDDSFRLYGTAAVAAIVFNFLVVFLAAESVYNKRRRLKTDDHNIWETTLCVCIYTSCTVPSSVASITHLILFIRVDSTVFPIVSDVLLLCPGLYL